MNRDQSELRHQLWYAWCAAAGAITLLSAGCSLFQPAPNYSTTAKKSAPAAKVEAPLLPFPIATDRFTFDPEHEDVVGRVQVTVATKEDTLPDLARRFNVGYEEIVRANPGVDPWLPGAGREIVLPTQYVLPDAPRDGIVINVAAMRLYYFPKHKKGEPAEVITHPIGIGKVGWQTPEGSTVVVARVKDPVWIPPASVRKEHLEDGDVLPDKVDAGPDNPLGAYMFRLRWPSYLIHGTNKPYGVGMRSSHGCVRLYPEDIVELYDSVPLGTTVRVVNQPYLLGWHGDELYVQAYGALEDDKRDWEHGPHPLAHKSSHSQARLWKRIHAEDAAIDWDAAHAVAVAPRGVPVPVMKSHAPSQPQVVAQAVRVANQLPVGASWDGNNAPAGDEGQFRDVMNAREPAAAATTAADGAGSP